MLRQSWWSRTSPQPPLPLRSLCFLVPLVNVSVRWVGYRCRAALANTFCTLDITPVLSQLVFLWWTPLENGYKVLINVNTCFTFFEMATYPGNQKSKIVNMISAILRNNNKVFCEKKETVNVINTSDAKQINIVEADMFNAMHQWKLDRTAAFVHTISADFTHPRHTSAGVAVKLRRKWGKPVSSDYIAERLTC
jgi:hypothetical protein